MPLSFLLGIADPSTVRGLEWLANRGEGGTPILRPDRLAYVGLRDLDVYERKILRRFRKEHGMFASTMQDVDRLGIGRVMELALEALGVVGSRDEQGNGDDGEMAPLHLSFDIDSVDPQVIESGNRINPEDYSLLTAMHSFRWFKVPSISRQPTVQCSLPFLHLQFRSLGFVISASNPLHRLPLQTIPNTRRHGVLQIPIYLFKRPSWESRCVKPTDRNITKKCMHRM